MSSLLFIVAQLRPLKERLLLRDRQGDRIHWLLQQLLQRLEDYHITKYGVMKAWKRPLNPLNNKSSQCDKQLKFTVSQSLPCMIESQVKWFMVHAVDQSHT